MNWLEDCERVWDWFQRFDLTKELKKNKGIVIWKNFFPPKVAEALLKELESTEVWNQTIHAEEDLEQNGVRHSFASTKQGTVLSSAIRAISLLRPQAALAFSAAKYEGFDFIEPHDDRKEVSVLENSGRVRMYERDVALVYYLTKDWNVGFGGQFCDLAGNKEIVPEFNSAVAFQIPRMHQVKPVLEGKTRFSVFGWFLKPLCSESSSGKRKRSNNDNNKKKSKS